MLVPSESIRQTRESRQTSNHRLQILNIIHMASGSGTQRFVLHEGSAEWQDYLGSEQGASYSILAQP